MKAAQIAFARDQAGNSASPRSAAGNSEGLAQLMARRKQGWSLEQDFYVNEGIFQQDMSRVFSKVWLFAGLSIQCPKPGDYITYQVGKDPILIIRGADGVLRAFFNVCTHRGSKIMTEPSGNKRVLVCPYHQWAFEPSGALKACRHMPADFDKSAFGLHPVRLEEHEGLIFICLSEQAPDFGDFAAALKKDLARHGLGRAKIAHQSSHSVRANWKLVVENFRECYHCGGSHPEYCGAVISAVTPDHPELLETEAKVNAGAARRWKELGLDTRTEWFSEDLWWITWRFPLQPGFISLTKDGKPCAPLMGSLPDRDIGVLAVTTAPQFWMEASSDHAMLIRLTPRSALWTDLDFYWLVDEKAEEGRDYDPMKVSEVWRATGSQDIRLCEVNQLGVDSSAYRPGPYSGIEGGSEVFVKWYLKRMAEAAPQAKERA